MRYLLTQDVSQLLGLKEEITVIGLLIVAIWYFWNENRKLKKDIKEVIDKHESDLKESNNDLKGLIQKYNDFTNEVKDLIRPRN